MKRHDEAMESSVFDLALNSHSSALSSEGEGRRAAMRQQLAQRVVVRRQRRQLRRAAVAVLVCVVGIGLWQAWSPERAPSDPSSRGLAAGFPASVQLVRSNPSVRSAALAPTDLRRAEVAVVSARDDAKTRVSGHRVAPAALVHNRALASEVRIGGPGAVASLRVHNRAFAAARIASRDLTPRLAVDDSGLLDLLRGAGRPTGLLRSGKRVFVTAKVIDEIATSD